MTALVVGSLAFLVISLVAAWASAQSMFSANTEAHLRAKALAEASVHRALAAACSDPNFLSQSPAFWEVKDDLGTGRISFDKDWAQARGIPLSVSNLAGMSAVPGGTGQSVPPHCMQLIGVGKCGQVSVQVTSVVYQGGYPYVIASQGPVQARSGLLVGALSGSAELGPGDMATNSGGVEAVRLGPACVVTGDVRASGGIILDPKATVKGQTLPNSSAVQIPQVPLANFKPTDPSLLGPSMCGQTLVGPNLCNQGLNIYGDLQLDGASLYVKGDLMVQGSIRGRGLVVTEGNLTISGGADMGSFDQAVLLTGGDMVLEGVDQAISRFQGLVYSEGSFRAKNISLVGVFISRGAAGTMLDTVQVTANTAYTHLDLSADQTQTFQFAAAKTADDDFHLDFAVPTSLASKLKQSASTSKAKITTSTVDISVQLANTAQGPVYRISDPYTGRIVEAATSEDALVQMRGLAENYFQALFPTQDVKITGQLQNLVNNIQSRTLLSALNNMNSGTSSTSLIQITPGQSFDLSQFLAPETSMRIVSWRVQ